jgi:ATP-binding cassette subfamily B protein
VKNSPFGGRAFIETVKEAYKNFAGLTQNLTLWRRALALVWQTVPFLTAGWIVVLIVQGLLPGAVVYFTKLTVDGFVAAKGASGEFGFYNPAVFYLALTGLCLILTEVFQFTGDWIRSAQAEYFSDRLKDLLHKKSAEVDLEFYESPEYHDLLEQVRGDAQSKPLALLESFGAVAQSAITLLTFAAILFSYGWLIPLLLLFGSLPGLYIALKYDRIYHRWWKESAIRRRWLAYYDAMLTHEGAASEMRLFDLSRRFRNKYQALRRRLRSEKLAHLRRQFSGKVLANISSLLVAAAALGWVARRVFYNLATVGDVVVFYQVFTRGQALMRSLLGGIGQTINHTLYLESLFSYLDLESRVVSPAEKIPFPERIREGIAFRNVTFYYPRERRAAIENFDLFIPAGRRVAIVGVNGAGKSTLIKLLCRFYDVQSGSIEIDGIDIRRFDIGELRRNISVLFQFPLQFHETAADNIALGDAADTAAPEKTKAAALAAGADGFISRLPEGYGTLLGKWFVNGCELSGGEWQRLALARAYFRRSKIIVLDEPTSFMDSWAEADWFNRFRKTAAEATGLIITHRFTIAMRADVIYVLDRGRLLESGTHRELVEANGFYAESWRQQMEAAEEYGGAPSEAFNAVSAAGNFD